MVNLFVMDVESIRRTCLAFPHAVEQIQWGDDLVFKVGGKMFAIVPLDRSSPNPVSLKCTPEEYAELIERPSIIPAPYLARHHWISLERWDALPAEELKRLLRTSYDLVVGKLPKKFRAALGKPTSRRRTTKR